MYSLYRSPARSPWIVAVLALALICFGLNSFELFCPDATGSEFRAAVATGDLGKVQALLSSDRNLISSCDNHGKTPLHWAAVAGQMEVAKILLANHADIDATNDNDATPLHDAAYWGHRDVAELLLENKADLHVRDRFGNTPLHDAALHGHADVAKLLLDRGAEIDTQSDDGWTSLHDAAARDYREVAELLLARGANVDARGKAILPSSDGKTPLSLKHRMDKQRRRN